MSVRSCLDDPTALVVTDASVAINLRATGVSGLILDALPSRVAVVQEVARELEAGLQRGPMGADSFGELVASGRMEVAQLGEEGMGHFTDLVSGHAAETLDDGEAATIAYALECGATAIIDERKANRICAERFDALRTACTVDVLTQSAVRHALGPTGLVDAVFNALCLGRMRVPAHHMDWTLDLIGPERAANCKSLPKSIRARL
jgi:predicted nucleic acid-binding protein